MIEPSEAVYEAAARARRLAMYGHVAVGLKPALGDRAVVDAVWPLAVAAARAQAATDIRAHADADNDCEPEEYRGWIRAAKIAEGSAAGGETP